MWNADVIYILIKKKYSYKFVSKDFDIQSHYNISNGKGISQNKQQLLAQKNIRLTYENFLRTLICEF